jgi:hypothetical protein
MESELLAIVEILKAFCDILLGQPIIVFTERLTCIEEYGPKFHYVKGSKNIVSDALSRLNITPCAPLLHHSCEFAEYYGIDTGNIDFP